MKSRKESFGAFCERTRLPPESYEVFLMWRTEQPATTFDVIHAIALVLIIVAFPLVPILVAVL